MKVFVARDQDEGLYLHRYKPGRQKDEKDNFGFWLNEDEDDVFENYIRLDGEMMPELTWEHEPLPCKLVLYPVE